MCFIDVAPPNTPPRTSIRCNAPTSASWSASTIAGRAMMRTSQPGWNEGAITLSASRSRRRTRFRTTAFPSRRPVDRPKRVVSRSVRRNRAENNGWDLVVPEPWIAAKSCGRESITSRGVGVPRSVVRPSAASDREPAGWPGCGDPLSSSCGRGSRVPWRDGASWAGRSASSSGLSEILSVRPRGTVAPTSPRGTQTRRHPTGAWRVFVRRMIWPVRNGCQTMGRHPGRGSRAPVARPGHRRGDSRVSSGRPHEYSLGVCGNRLATPSAPVLSSPSPRRRDVRGRPHAGLGLWQGSESSGSGWASNDASRTLASPTPTVAGAIYRPSLKAQVPSNEWTRSKSGEPPSVSSRSPCRPPTTRRGCAIPSSSTWTSSGSGSPSRTASRRTGSRPAIAR